MDSRDNQPHKNHHFYQALDHALAGIGQAVKTERNLRFHLLAAGVVIIGAFLLKVSLTDWCLLLIAIGLVIASELVNTAVEAAVDAAVGKHYDPMAKKAKDVAAAAVLVNASLAAVIGLIVFLPRIIEKLA